MASKMPWSRMKEDNYENRSDRGTGLIGQKLVNKLREHGHEAVAGITQTRVSTLSRRGTGRSAERCLGIVDVSNSPSGGRSSLKFFETSTRNLLIYEAAAGGHHVALSVVGTQQLAEKWLLPG